MLYGYRASGLVLRGIRAGWHGPDGVAGNGIREKGRQVMARASAGQILVGTDGSAAAAAAVRWAAAEAGFRGVRLHVVYVRDRYRPEPAPYAQPGESYADDLPGPPETALRQAVHAALGPHLPPDCLLEAAEGLPVHVLLDRAEGARMLVLGSRLAGNRLRTGPRSRSARSSGTACAARHAPSWWCPPATRNPRPAPLPAW